MSKRAKRGKAESLALPVAGELQLASWPLPHWGTVCCLALRACNRYGSRPCTKSKHRQLQFTYQLQFSASATAPAPIPPQAPRIETPKAADAPGDLFGRWLTTPATRRQAP